MPRQQILVRSHLAFAAKARDCRLIVWERAMSRESLAVIRAAVGLAQGAALNLLYDAAEAKVWPATDGQVFAPLVLTAMFVPTLAVAGLGDLRLRTFAIWIAAAAVIVPALGAYDVFHDPVGSPFARPPRVPSVPLWFAVAAGLFIAHALVASGDEDRAFIARYPRYFDVAWKQAVQVGLAAVFVGALWVLLYLGAALFRLIEIRFLEELLQKPWFGIPASTLAVALALHVTDVQAGIVQGVRTLKLTLLSWLLPLITLIAAGFLVALLFTGLDPLWSTRRATAVVLMTAVALIVLINAAYQEGDARERPVVFVLRCAGIGAAIALTPLVVIAAYAVLLRVRQYGWTPERIVATACVVVAASYAIGYGLAAVRSQPWLRWVETTNVVASIVILAAILALFSPVADPMRIAVADQVARLEAGRIPVERFDFAFLRLHGGRYGTAALERLRQKEDGPEAARIAEKANAILVPKTTVEIRISIDHPTPAERAANITVIYPKDQSMPPSFLQQDWDALQDRARHPRCVTAHVKCDAVLLDLDGDGIPEILLAVQSYGAFVVYKETAGRWTILGPLHNSGCKGVKEELLVGHFELATPEFKDVKVGDERLQVQPYPGCP
jgi:hypothetical protein